MVDTMTNFAAERDAMIERQIEARGIHEPTILEAFRSVPREEFLSKDYADLAYGDHPLPIEAGLSLSQPYHVALMIQAAEMKAGDTVLEVGAGSGYAAAIMSRIAGRVTAVERQPDLVKVAQERMQRLGFDNVRIVQGDGTRGWEPEAPYDAILAAASGSHIPPAWIDQLADGGRIVMPVGEPTFIQKLIKVTRGPAGKLITEDLGGVRFVPLIGEEGWNDA
jgi:protein-L-isoaspartate(D-aspartate) O-methyltransferase